MKERKTIKKVETREKTNMTTGNGGRIEDTGGRKERKKEVEVVK